MPGYRIYWPPDPGLAVDWVYGGTLRIRRNPELRGTGGGPPNYRHVFTNGDAEFAVATERKQQL
jgi:hypothetical protein